MQQYEACNAWIPACPAWRARDGGRGHMRDRYLDAAVGALSYITEAINSVRGPVPCTLLEAAGGGWG